MLITITKDMIRQGLTGKGGYKKQQLLAIGVGWPPEKGWIDKIVGRQIDSTAYKRFIELKRTKKSRQKSRKQRKVGSSEFLESYEWRKLRYQALLKHGKACQCCGATPQTGAILNVDHIKPRKTHPELSLDIDNLQVLCHECNHGKGNWDTTDHRSNS